jgi:hypothetical protein
VQLTARRLLRYDWRLTTISNHFTIFEQFLVFLLLKFAMTRALVALATKPSVSWTKVTRTTRALTALGLELHIHHNCVLLSYLCC